MNIFNYRSPGWQNHQSQWVRMRQMSSSISLDLGSDVGARSAFYLFFSEYLHYLQSYVCTHTHSAAPIGGNVMTVGCKSPTGSLLSWPSYCIMVCIIICNAVIQRHQSIKEMQDSHWIVLGGWRAEHAWGNNIWINYMVLKWWDD